MACLVARALKNLQMIWPLAIDHPEDLATCKWSSRGTGHLQMIIWRIWPLPNDHLEDPASCKWSSRWSRRLQMIIRRIQPFAKDRLEDPASCKWSSRVAVVNWDNFKLEYCDILKVLSLAQIQRLCNQNNGPIAKLKSLTWSTWPWPNSWPGP